jgi:hypothetical protein
VGGGSLLSSVRDINLFEEAHATLIEGYLQLLEKLRSPKLNTWQSIIFLIAGFSA